MVEAHDIQVRGGDEVGVQDQDQDWAGRATATVVGYVDTVRNASTGKALTASRYAVYGVAAGLLGMMMAIVFLILLVRFVSAAIVSLFGIGDFVDLEDGTVWPAYLVLGALFLAIGLWLWRKKDQ